MIQTVSIQTMSKEPVLVKASDTKDGLVIVRIDADVYIFTKFYAKQFAAALTKAAEGEESK